MNILNVVQFIKALYYSEIDVNILSNSISYYELRYH